MDRNLNNNQPHPGEDDYRTETELNQSSNLPFNPPPKIPDYELVRCIGGGSYGDVWLARSVMGTYRAVKVVYRKRFEHRRPYEREFDGIRKFEPVSRTHESQNLSGDVDHSHALFEFLRYLN